MHTTTSGTKGCARPRLRTVGVCLATAMAFCLLLAASAPRVLAQAGGTTPIPTNADWDDETANAAAAINAWRAAQQAPLPPLQVDTTLQNAAAWMANNQLVTRNCLGDQNNRFCSQSGTDSLARFPNDRLTAFGYTGAFTELLSFTGLDGTNDITTGQGVVFSWINSTRSTAPNQALLTPTATAVGIARQCQTFSYGFACLWWAEIGSSVGQAFAPAAQNQPAAGPLTGSWNVDNFGGGTGGTARLVQAGNQVFGTYVYADPSGCGQQSGSFFGTVNGGSLMFTAFEAGCVTPNGARLSGTAMISADNQTLAGGASWNATRTGP